MSRKLLAAFALFLISGNVAHAHRLDEYLQATILSVQKDHLNASMRLIPGVAVSSAVIASIDNDGDGLFSAQEQQAYANRVLADLSLTLDAAPLQPKLVSISFPTAAEMREGLGEIHIEFTANLPTGGFNRRLLLENRHQNRDSAYLVNSLAPSDPSIQVTAQHRNEQQSLYELDYVQTSVPTPPAGASIRARFEASSFPALFHLGLRHIAEGTDHLLFLLVLLLPAPLLVDHSRWAGFAGFRSSLLRILKVVTAFTLGHSLTLALAGFGIVSAPSRPIEVLIALSILVSAIHALRPLFPGKEAAIAAFFGLIHGMAFAATLTSLGLTRADRILGILAFNLGIETMQLFVVALVMPSLLLLSRTRAYPFVRIGGAIVAAIAALGWIDERLFGGHTSIDVLASTVAHHALWLAASLFLISLTCLRPSNSPVK